MNVKIERLKHIEQQIRQKVHLFKSFKSYFEITADLESNFSVKKLKSLYEAYEDAEIDKYHESV